jgi:iron(III) transport system ATP-binding protein
MIRVAGLTKVFGAGREGVKAVDQVSFEVPQGQLFTLLGPSGCGKTTTLRSIAGLETPTEGEISIGGETVFSHTSGVLVRPNKRNIGMVFQSYAIWPHMTVFQNVAYPLKSKRFSRAEAKKRALNALETVGLRDLADRPAPKLSGGQQQRVALARAIAGDPKVLLLDEPLSNLDAKLREDMRIGIRNLQRRLGITAIYVTHDQIEALTISDQIAVMDRGKIVELGTPRGIYLQPKSRFAATFVGLTNVIPGQRKNPRTAAATSVETPIGEIRCNLIESYNGKRDLLVLVRPESVKVYHVAPPVTENVWLAEVRERIFMGNFMECQVSVNGFILHVRLDPYFEILEGNKVYIRIDPDRCTVIEADAS